MPILKVTQDELSAARGPYHIIFGKGAALNRSFTVSSLINSFLYYIQICCIALRVCKLLMGFSVPSIIGVGALAQLSPQKQNSV